MKSTQFQNIFESAYKLMQPMSESETYSVIAHETKRLIGADYVSIFLQKDGELQRVFTTIPLESRVEPRKDGYTHQCLVSQKAFVIPITEFRKNHPEFKNKTVKQVALVPLSHNKKTLGVLSCQLHDRQRFSQNKFQMFQLFGSMASLKIENNALVNNLKDALSTRDLFISMASHELKTPLTTVSAYAQLFQRKAEHSRSVNKKWADTLVFASNRLTHLINELLQVSQIRTGKLTYDFEKLNFKTAILKQIKEDFQVVHSSHKLTVENHLGPKAFYVYADREKLIQVVTNILNNAAKFSPTDGKITLTCEQAAKQFKITVTDEGQGIAPDDLAHLFEEFYRAKNSKVSGMGLGLYISKNIVDEHHGKIRIKSKLGKGTQVQIILPIAHKLLHDQ